MTNRYLPVGVRLMLRVDKTETCWNWTGTTKGGDYGRIRHNGRTALAHRVSYELHVGPIPEGLTLDHLCRNTRCVNPDHLEPVTNAENVRREALAITACPRGHLYDDENTYVNPNPESRGGRNCRTCHREVERAKYVPVAGLPANPCVFCGTNITAPNRKRHEAMHHRNRVDTKEST